LDPKGFVLVDEYFLLKNGNDSAENVFAIGDVSALEWSQFITTDRQSSHLAKNLVLLLSSQKPVKYQLTASRRSPSFSPLPAWQSVVYEGLLTMWICRTHGNANRSQNCGCTFWELEDARFLDSVGEKDALH
jgi:hypothetical protein